MHKSNMCGPTNILPFVHKKILSRIKLNNIYFKIVFEPKLLILG